MTRSGGNAGFSLIEVLIAAAVLASALAGLAMILPRALDATRESGERFTATMAARQKLDELLTSVNATGFAPSGEDVVALSGAGRFERRWRIEAAEGGAGPLAIRVEVRRAGAGIAGRTTLATLWMPRR
jgi:prepilin-type N-terminal cleavage/methylation domain-containing protein